MSENLGDIRLFVEAARLGSLSAAGRKLGLSAAAASARLTKLEAAVGARLFERSTRQLRLSGEGQVYLAHCQEALGALDDGRAALQSGTTRARGKIRVSATSDFGRHTLKAWLDGFMALYPEVTLALTLSDSLADLIHDEIDLALRFGRPADGSVVARQLAANRRVLCASPAFVARHGMPEHPVDLARFECIVMQASPGSPVEWRFEREGVAESFSVPVQTALETNDGAIARAWAVDGRGIALKSTWDIGADLLAQRLQVVMPQWRLPDAPVHALYRRSRYMPTRVRLLLDFLADRFAAGSADIERALLAPGPASPGAEADRVRTPAPPAESRSR